MGSGSDSEPLQLTQGLWFIYNPTYATPFDQSWQEAFCMSTAFSVMQQLAALADPPLDSIHVHGCAVVPDAYVAYPSLQFVLGLSDADMATFSTRVDPKRVGDILVQEANNALQLACDMGNLKLIRLTKNQLDPEDLDTYIMQYACDPWPVPAGTGGAL